MTALPLADAARELNVCRRTLERWVSEGCPTVRRGSRGRGRATLIDPAAAQQWAADRDANPTEDSRARLLQQLAADAPGLAVDAGLAALAHYSPEARTGAERRLLREAVRFMAREVERSLVLWTENKTDGSRIF